MRQMSSRSLIPTRVLGARKCMGRLELCSVMKSIVDYLIYHTSFCPAFTCPAIESSRVWKYQHQHPLAWFASIILMWLHFIMIQWTFCYSIASYSSIQRNISALGMMAHVAMCIKMIQCSCDSIPPTLLHFNTRCCFYSLTGAHFYFQGCKGGWYITEQNFREGNCS